MSLVLDYKPLADLTKAASVAHDKGKRIATSDDGGLCHIVLSGVLASCQWVPAGSRQIVGYHLPGDICGLAAVTGLGQGSGVSALSPAASVPLAARTLADLAVTSSTWCRTLLNAICIEASIAHCWIANGHRSALHRIAHHLCELEARLGAVGLSDDASFRWWGNQADLGAATGLSLVHVNKILRTLRGERLVEWGSTIRILDLPRLRSFAGFDPSYLCLDQPRLGHLLVPDLARQTGTKGGGGDRAQADLATLSP